MAKKKGVFVPGAGEENDDLGKEFMASPEKFAVAHDLDPDNLGCPEIAHEAFERARKLETNLAMADLAPDAASMTRINEMVTDHFGQDYDVALIPFGLKFREKIPSAGLDITATGTGSVTWLDTDADVDS